MACNTKCIKTYKYKNRYLQKQLPLRCKHNMFICYLKYKQGEEAEIIATLPREYGAGLAGAAPRSRAGSTASYNSTVTLRSIQGCKVQIARQLDDLERAQLTVKNMCTTMVLSGLKTLLIDQYITVYQEEVVDF